MNFEAALSAELESVSGLSRKVYGLTGIESATAPAAPYLIFVSSEGLQEKAFEGYLALKEVDFELNILHSTYSNMKALTALVLAKVISFQSRAIGTNGPYIQNVTYEKPVELYESLVKMHRCNIIAKVTF